MDSINEGDLFLHHETGSKCVAVGTGSMKVEDGSWQDAVSYRNLESDNPSRVFTRSEAAFREKFKRF